MGSLSRLLVPRFARHAGHPGRAVKSRRAALPRSGNNNLRRSLVTTISAAATFGLAACGTTGSPPAAHSTSAHARPAAASYKDVDSLIAAMAVHGAICSGVQFVNSTASGALSPHVGCTGSTSGDTSILVFINHADALAFANQQLAVGASVNQPTAEAVGPDWVVNTVPSFASKIVAAVGGQLLTQAPASTAPAAEPTTPAASAVPAVVQVHFYVSGTGEPSIQYGSDSDEINTPGGLGTLGDGNALPWHASLQFDPTAEYYDISAQLEDGGGSISCTIVVTEAGYNPLTVATGQASGDYSICSAQAAPTDSTGMSWSKE
jgi:hypothetical protein